MLSDLIHCLNNHVWENFTLRDSYLTQPTYPALLSSVLIDSVLPINNFDFDQFCRNVDQQKLSLSHLSVESLADNFLSMCRLDQLKSLKIALPDEQQGVERICEKLTSCKSLKTLIVDISPKLKILESLFTATESIPELSDFSLECCCDSLNNLREVSTNERYCQSITKLKLSILHQFDSSDTVLWRMFPKINHLFVKSKKLFRALLLT